MRIEEENEIVTLKNGAELPIGSVLPDIAYLRRLLEREREPVRGRPNGEEIIKGIYRIASGKPEEVSEELKDHLCKRRMLCEDGTFLGDWKDIILSSYRETPDGVTLVDPIAAQSQEVADKIEKVSQLQKERFLKNMRDVIKGEKDQDVDEGFSP